MLKTEITITYYAAFKEFIILAIPSTLGMLLKRGVLITNYIFVSRLNNPDFLAGVGLGELTWSIMVSTISIGLGGGIDTLSSQAYGNKSYYLAGWYFHRAIVIVTVLFVFQVIMLFNAYEILIWIGQPAESAYYASVFVKYYVVGVLSLTYTDILRKFLATQSNFNLIPLVQIFTYIIHIFSLCLFVNKWDMGVKGIGIASSITHTLTFLISVGTITYSKKIIHPQSWHWFNKDSFTGFWEFLKYGAPSYLMVILEIWSFQALLLFSGMLGTIEQAVVTITMSMSMLFFQIAHGFAMSAGNKVGNYLGAGLPRISKTYYRISVITTATCSVIYFTMMVWLKHQITHMYTYNEQLVKMTVEIMPMVGLFLAFDIIQGSIGGSIRAMGYQSFSSMVSFVAYWVIALPLTYYFTFTLDLRLKGIWTGMIIGTFTVGVSYIIKIHFINWEELSFKVMDRIKKERIELGEMKSDSSHSWRSSL
jgi:multidrug resistance protein, MATE family